MNLSVDVPIFKFNSDIDDCSGRPRQNGGNCTDEVNDIRCDCVAGYTLGLLKTDKKQQQRFNEQPCLIL